MASAASTFVPFSNVILNPSSVLPAVFLPLHLSFLPPSALYLSAIRQIVAGLICIMSATIPIGAPHSCLLKDSGATAPIPLTDPMDQTDTWSASAHYELWPPATADTLFPL